MGFKNFLEFFQFKDEDDDYDDDDEDDIVEERRLTKRGEKVEPERPVRQATSPATGRQQAAPSPRSASSNDAPVQRSVRMERTSNNKVVPIKTTSRNFEVCIMKPTSFSDAQDICDMLMNGRAAVVNLEGFDPVEAQRIMDFVSGCIYTMNGRFHQISRYIFIFSPENVDISGDYQDFLGDGNFGVPTINKDF